METCIKIDDLGVPHFRKPPYIHPYRHRYIHTYIRTYIHTYIHTYMRYIHIHVSYTPCNMAIPTNQGFTHVLLWQLHKGGFTHCQVARPRCAKAQLRLVFQVTSCALEQGLRCGNLALVAGLDAFQTLTELYCDLLAQDFYKSALCSELSWPSSRSRNSKQ